MALDEPTSDLDPRSRRELISILQGLPVTQLVATHDLELVVHLCPRVIVLDQGQIVADGNTVELLSNEPLMLKHGLERPHILLHQHPHFAECGVKPSRTLRPADRECGQINGIGSSAMGPLFTLELANLVPALRMILNQLDNSQT